MMRRVFTYGRKYEIRNLTLPDIRKAKASGMKLVQAFASDEGEARAVYEAGLDMMTVLSSWTETARSAAPEMHITAALGGNELVTDEDVLREAMRASIAGADQLHTMRRLELVELLAKEGFAVQGHVGLVPRKSVTTGGLRAFGKTASEAASILQDIRRLEDAGAVSVEVECLAADAMAAISARTRLVTHGIGSGCGADVIYMFAADISGDNPSPPRHAKAFADLLSIRQELDSERLRALREFGSAVRTGEFPDVSVSIEMAPGEKSKLEDALDSVKSVHR